MKKIVYSVFFVFVFFLTFSVYALDVDLNSTNIIVYNLNDDEIIYKEKEEEQIKIASLTKMMTILVSSENIKDYDEKITFPKINKSKLFDYTQANFNIGSKYTYNDLLYAAMLPSAADATEGLALLISGSLDDFVLLMNKKAEEIGLENTHFANTYGEDTDNYSTASDLLTLLKYALKNKKFYELFTTKKYTMSNGKTVSSSVEYYTKNYDLDTTNILGSKTGYTKKAGLCMASIYKKGNMEYIIITLGAPSSNTPYQVMDNVNIGNYLYENYEYVDLIKKGDLLAEIKLFGPFKKKIYSEEDIQKYLPKDKKIVREYKGKNRINKKTKINDELGKYIVTYDGNKVYEISIKVENTNDYKIAIFMRKSIAFILLFIALISILFVIKINKKHKKYHFYLTKGK